jgi:hypothetical protein
LNPPKNEEELREWLQVMAGFIREQLPGHGFVLLTYVHGPAQGSLNYVSNSRRDDVVRAMREFITMTEARWGEHIPESDEDSELGRLRQRVALLESRQRRLFDSGFGYGRHLSFDPDESWKMYLESIGDQY